jgi:phosphohistidine swiveling domain-containing protein
MENITFHKVYTRDNCFLVQETWFRSYLKGFNDDKNPFSPPVFFFIENGMVDLWENKKAINWFLDSLLERNRKDKDFFANSVKQYNQFLDKLNDYWQKDHLNSIEELKGFINIMEADTRYFMIYYYSCYDERNPENIRKQSLKMRAADSYYDDSDRLIRKTIEFIYPEINYDLSLSILYKELDNPPSVESLVERNKNCSLIVDDSLKIIKFEEIKKIYPNFLFIQEDIVTADVIKGATAFKGRVKGRVRILRQKSSISSLQEGEILVSPMTTPSFLPAMKKAAAIVTDEGGITCHAAVVAREIARPCITGTKIATKFLRDGDLVEVDANKGEVKIIKHG